MKNLVDTRLPNVFLKPGEVYVSRAPALVSTVLGSCVSVTLFSKDAGMGAICHALLPFGTGHDNLRYVDCALTFMHDKLVTISGQSGRFEAKLFGGAEMLMPRGSTDAQASVGRQNVEAALKTIEKLGLVLTASDTGGNRGRKIFFYSDTGEVFLRPVKKTIR